MTKPAHSEPKLVKIPEGVLYDAFMKHHKPIGIFSEDSKHFDTFQKGWNAAFDWVNATVMEKQTTKPRKEK